MSCAHCRDAGAFFHDRTARRELRRYRRRGPSGTTRHLLDALLQRLPAGGFTALDVGGGVGAVQHALLERGAERVVAVDASAGYLRAAREEARSRGLDGRLEQMEGDFVELAARVPDVDVVTLDRVVCCYPDMPALVGASADRARRLYGVVVPRERWWVRIGLAATNLYLRLRRSAFRVYLHPLPALRSELEQRGFGEVHTQRSFVWRVMVFERRSAGRSTAD